jgi:hypothetical protein
MTAEKIRSKLMIIDDLKRRYFRKTIGYPKGILTHFGDCSIYGCYVCDCGLIRDLRSILCSMAPRQRKNTEKMLPEGFMDDSYAKHEVITTRLNQTDWYAKEWKRAQEYAKSHPIGKREFHKMMTAMGFKIEK